MPCVFVVARYRKNVKRGGGVGEEKRGGWLYLFFGTRGNKINTYTAGQGTTFKT